MASTTFVDFDPNTPIVAAWLNDVNTTVYTALGDGVHAPLTADTVRTNLGIARVVTSISLARSSLTGISSPWAFINGGFYVRVATSQGSYIDNGGTIIVAADGSVWQYADTAPPTFNTFEAVGDGLTDDSAAILLAAAAGVFSGEFGRTYLITNYSILVNYGGLLTGQGSLLYSGTILPLGLITSAITLNFPSVFTSLLDAVNYLNPRQFSPSGSAVVKIADGTYAVPQIQPNFVQGESISFIGDQGNPTNVVLNFTTSGTNTCGFHFQNGVNCGLIDGVYIQGNGWLAYGSWATNSYGAGIRADYGSEVGVGANVQVNKHYYGIQARWGSKINCAAGVQVFYAGDCGFHAFAGSVINAQGCKAFDTADNGAGLGFGFCSEGSSFIDCSTSNTSANAKDGFYALTNGSMWAHSCEADNNGQHGFHALDGGSIEIIPPPGGAQPNSYENAGYGYYAELGGKMNCNSCLANQNTGGGFGCVQKSAMDVTAASATNNSGDGFYCEGSSHMEGNPVNSYNNSGIGMHCINGSSASFSGGTINQNAGGGLWATQSSTINAPNASVIQSGNHGVLAQDSSSILGNSIVSNQATNSGNGFYASSCSTIRGTSLSANNNAGWGFYADNLAFMNATSGGGTGNTAGFRNPANNGTSGNLGAFIQM